MSKKGLKKKRDHFFILGPCHDYMEFNKYLEDLDNLPAVTVANKEII